MNKRRVSFFVHDLAANPIVRVIPLARALSTEFDVEILGFLLSGNEVYEPYRSMYEYKVLRCSRDVTTILSNMRKLAKLATGDLIYACKPLATSFGPALCAAGAGWKKPLFLDIEDDELVPRGKTWPDFVWKDILKGWRHATAWKYTRVLHLCTPLVKDITVSSVKLQRRYGGTIVLHGPDELIFDPSQLSSKDSLSYRFQFGLPADRKLALFAGTPQPHKGWPVLLAALLRPECRKWDLVLAGPTDHDDFALAKSRLGDRCHVLGPVAHTAMPLLLSAVDAVPVPQSSRVFSESQVPAKALEAMAMAKPVIASRVGDLPEIVGHGLRGWLCSPDDDVTLAAALAEIGANPLEAQRRGLAARYWYLEHASGAAIRTRLLPSLTAALTQS